MIDRHSIFFVHGLLLVALGLGMVFPALLDTVDPQSDGTVFVVSAALTVAVGGLLVAASQGRPLTITRKAGFLLTTTAWLLVSIFAAIPFVFAGRGLSFADGFFEAVSGLTTTGSTILVGIESYSPGLKLWRGILNLLGGIGIVGMAIVLFPFLEIGGMQLFRTESSDKSDHILQGARRTATAILIIYLLLVLACGLLYWIFGMVPLDAAVHAMATLATGGFCNSDASFIPFHGPILWTAIVFMMAGALPLAVFVRLSVGDIRAFFADSQIRTFLLAMIFLCLVVAFWQTERTGWNFGNALTQVTFNIVSIVTTTGFVSADYSQWGTFFVMLILVLTFVGGCTGSTAGGIKIMRFEILYRLVTHHVRRLLDPHAVVPLKYAGRPISDDVFLSVTVFLLLYVVTVALIAMLLALMGYDMVTAISGSATAVGNVGPGLGAIIGPVGNFSSLTDPAKVLLAIGMLLGRLEMFTILVLFTPRYWTA